MTFRFYCPPPLAPINTPFKLPEAVFHHAVNVLRMRVGDTFILFDGIGHAALAQLIEVDKKSAQALLTQPLDESLESPLHITLAQCLSVGDKMDWTIEKAVELGVTQIVPLFSAKSQIKLTPERAAKKLEHWQRIVISAAAQCGRNVLPELHAPMALSRFLAAPRNELKLMLHPNGAVPFKQLTCPVDAKVTLLIGPEAGFDAGELTIAANTGYINTVLGPRVLRTESAGLAAIAAIQTVWGDF